MIKFPLFGFISWRVNLKFATLLQKKVENYNISGCEVAEELDILVNKLKNRGVENLCTSEHMFLL
jgi:hypothetical protein